MFGQVLPSAPHTGWKETHSPTGGSTQVWVGPPISPTHRVEGDTLTYRWQHTGLGRSSHQPHTQGGRRHTHLQVAVHRFG